MTWTTLDDNLMRAGFTKTSAEELRDAPLSLYTLRLTLRALVIKYRYHERAHLLDAYIADYDQHSTGVPRTALYALAK